MMTMLFATAAGLITLFLYNSGILANTKSQLQNAADAAAYSGAVMLARDHNFSAYTNRAMVANQVAVAQFVSIKSYLEDAAATNRRMRATLLTVYSQIPTQKPVWNQMRNLQVQQAYNQYMNSAPTAVRSLDRLIGILSTSQTLHHGATVFSVLDVVDEVAKKNDPHASVTTGVIRDASVIQIARWNNYTHQHRANDASAAADRFANVVVDRQSTDGFTRNRGGILNAAWASLPVGIACGAGVPIWTVFGFTHEGGTQLSRDKRRWLGLDATMGLGAVSCMTPTPLGPVFWGYPLLEGGGSGGGLAGSGRYDDPGFSGNPADTRGYGGARTNPLTMVPARQRYNNGPGTSLDTAGGLQDNYRDVRHFSGTAGTITRQTPEQNGGDVPLTIEVEHRAADIRTASRVVGTGAANIRLNDNLKGGTMRTLSSAHAYFYRPKNNSNRFTRNHWERADRRAEMANLFNPYWQARLVDHSDGHRGASAGAQ